MLDVSRWLSQKAEEVLRRLLETKHLYQSVSLDREALKSEASATGVSGGMEAGAAIDRALDSPWYAHDEISLQRAERFRPPSGIQVPPSIGFYVESIKTSCSTCAANTPFNLVRAMDVYRDQDRGWQTFRAPETEQDFILLFQCQSCRSAPDVFIVRRRRERITLCGRAPIEWVEVPKYIPRQVQRYYSGAIVAFQSGQILAALFLLRVVIEQVTRHAVKAGNGLRADEALDRYVSLLPDDFKKRFPSLRETYGDLSEAIHAAEESTEVFETSLERIKKHFDAKRMYEL